MQSAKSRLLRFTVLRSIESSGVAHITEFHPSFEQFSSFGLVVTRQFED